MVVVSSYRSYAYQAGIKARWCPDNLCAKAGYSEHQSWLTADLWSASSNAYWKSSSRLMWFYNWLVENAHLYWFSNSYQNGREVDGYEIEPWHWRYMWVKFASYLKQENMTFAQFYYSIENDK
jgi:D-alanyl-D-alanine carboxypeptidase